MENLSHLVPGLVPESQAATNTVSTNQASTAPGSPSESTSGESAGNPELTAGPARPLTVTDPSAAPRNGNPWRRADGTPWEQS